MPILGHHMAAPALTTASLGRAPEMCASTRTSESTTRTAGLTPGLTASVFPNTKSKRVLGANTRPKGTLSPHHQK